MTKMKPIEFEVFERQASVPLAGDSPPSRASNINDKTPSRDERVRIETVPMERPFFNNHIEPAYRLGKERPNHRVICFLKAQGKTNVEIAEMVGVAPFTVNYTVNQPWAKQMIADEIGKAGRSEVEALLQGEVADSVRKLIDIRDSAEASADVQRKAANDILDRFYGKPNQRIISTNVDPNQLSDAELAEIVKRGSN